jgi:hypothetical protein
VQDRGAGRIGKSMGGQPFAHDGGIELHRADARLSFVTLCHDEKMGMLGWLPGFTFSAIKVLATPITLRPSPQASQSQ